MRTAEIDAGKEPILDYMAGSGVSALNVDGYTVYVHQQVWAAARDGDYDRACEALIQAGLGDLVQPRFNVNSLSAWVRERLAAGDELPASFEAAIGVTTQVDLRARKSGGRS